MLEVCGLRVDTERLKLVVGGRTAEGFPSQAETQLPLKSRRTAIEQIEGREYNYVGQFSVGCFEFEMIRPHEFSAKALGQFSEF